MSLGIVTSAGTTALTDVGNPMKKHLVLNAQNKISVEREDVVACFRIRLRIRN